MADIIPSSKRGQDKYALKRNQRKPLQVDLTPMVDLGFLLITFFVFTTTLSTSTAMHLTMPDDKGSSMNTPESGAVTILLSGNNRLHYYSGKLKEDLSNVHNTDYKEIRNILMRKKKDIPSEKLMIIIVPGNNSSYKNVVDILDEMHITVIDRYALINNPQSEHLTVFEKM